MRTGASGSGGDCPDDNPPSTCPAGAAGYQATIAPLLAEHCVQCHQAGGVATPFLQTYAQVAGAIGVVVDEVHSCRMPPEGYPALTEEERAELFGWVACMAPDD